MPAEASLSNPVDLLGSATAETYASALPPIVADDEVDAVIVLFVPAAEVAAADVAASVANVRAGAEKPIVPVILAAETQPGSFSVPRVGGAGAWPGGGARRVAAPARRHRAEGRRDRPRPC